MTYFPIDARGSGTGNGRHLVSLICAPNQIGIQIGDKGGLQSGRIRGQAWHQPHDSI
jgi:hypothetical protein